MNDITHVFFSYYRNAIYQGYFNKQNQQKCGCGLLYLVREQIIVGSHWQYNVANGPTFVYYSNSNYTYGFWKNNNPHGFNFVRLGPMLVMGFYQNGALVGNLLVLYEKYNLAVILSLNPDQEHQQFDVISKGEVYSDEDFQNFVTNSGWNYFQENWKTLIKFLSANFTSDDSKSPKLKLRLVNQNYYRFGYDEGLAVMFDDDYSLLSMGIHRKSKVVGLGFRRTKQKFYEEGNFGIEEAVFAYNLKQNRPNKKLQKVFSQYLLKSLDFINACMYDPAKSLVKYYSQLGDCNLFKTILAGQITNRKMDLSFDSPYSTKKRETDRKINLLQIPPQTPYQTKQEALPHEKIRSFQQLNSKDKKSLRQDSEYSQEKKRLKIYQKQLKQQIQKKKGTYNQLEPQQIEKNKLIINKSPVMVKNKPTTRKTEMNEKSKQKQRSPIFTPQKNTGKQFSPSPVRQQKQPLSPFKEKMKSKLFKESKKKQRYIFEPIQELPSQNSGAKQFKLTRPQKKYESPYHQLPIEFSKGESYHQQSSIGNVVPLSLQQNKAYKKKQNKNSVYTQYEEYKRENERKKKNSSISFKDQTPQFIPIDAEKREKELRRNPKKVKQETEIKNKTKSNRNNIYLENVERWDPDYDHKMQRSKPKTYLGQFQRQRSIPRKDSSMQKKQEAKRYDRTIQAFNQSNKVYDIVNSPESKKQYGYFPQNPYQKSPQTAQSKPNTATNKRQKYEYYFQ